MVAEVREETKQIIEGAIAKGRAEADAFETKRRRIREERKPLPRDVHIIAEVKELLDGLAIDKRDPILRRAFFEELIAEATARVENLS